MGENIRSKKVYEGIIKCDFDLEKVLNALRFFWNLARSRKENVVVELWEEPKNLEEKGG